MTQSVPVLDAAILSKGEIGRLDHSSGRGTQTSRTGGRTGGAFDRIKGNILYPAILLSLSWLSRIFTKDRNELK
ncbi:MAG: hypothetical protein ABW184_06820 [Sphingobium sp.]